MDSIRKHHSSHLLGAMYWGLLIGLLAARAQAGFALAGIQWQGLPTKSFILAPGNLLNSASGPQQQLIITDQVHSDSRKDTPHFAVKPDKTIAWDARNLCVEAGTNGHSIADTVRLSKCTGGPNQKWDCLRWGSGQATIRLSEANKCLSVDDRQAGFPEKGLNGAPVVLRECEDNARGMWNIEQPFLVPTGGSSQLPAPFHWLQPVVISVTLLAFLGASSLSAWLWWWRQAKAPSQCGTPWKEDHGGISLVTPVAMHRSSVMSAPINETRMHPAAMAIRTIPGADADTGNVADREWAADELNRRDMFRCIVATMALTPAAACAKVGSTNPANNYYFPMARYRYAPRILRAWIAVDELSQNVLDTKDWEGMEIIWYRMDDATTAMPLYTNSVEGSRSTKRKTKSDTQKEMYAVTATYTDACKDLRQACDRKDGRKTRAALDKAKTALAKYRALAKIDGEDGGVIVTNNSSSGRVGRGPDDQSYVIPAMRGGGRNNMNVESFRKLR